MPAASHRFFSNKDCRYFPCHRQGDPEAFNCLFCYCPLYFVPHCGGTPRYLDNGVKDCSLCIRPHRPEAYEDILDTLRRHISVVAKDTNAEPPGPDGRTEPRA